MSISRLLTVSGVIFTPKVEGVGCTAVVVVGAVVVVVVVMPKAGADDPKVNPFDEGAVLPNAKGAGAVVVPANDGGFGLVVLL